MKNFKKIMIIPLVMILCLGGMISTAGANVTDNQMKKIIRFNDHIAPQVIDAQIRNWKDSGAATVTRLPLINGLSLRLPEKDSVNALASNPIVKSIEDDQEVFIPSVMAAEESGALTLLSDVSYEDISVYRPWAIVKLQGQPYVPGTTLAVFDETRIPESIIEANGSIKIAVFDTGVDYSHPNLNGIIKGGVDFINIPDGMTMDQLIQTSDQIPMDDNGHGTHVSGTISGQDIGLGIDFSLYVVKVLDQDATGNLSTLINAIDWAITNGIEVINMSLAFRDDSPAVGLAIQKAHEAGIVLVAAAGNHSNWINDEGDAGDGGAGDGGAGDGGAGDGGAGDGGAADDGTVDTNVYPVMYPALYPEVIAVGASDPWENIAEFSNIGPEIDIMAPGVDILSTYLGGEFAIYNGTSMAAPHVTATVAMMLAYDRHLNSQISNPEQIRSLLKDSANSTDQSAGELNLINTLIGVSELNRYFNY